MFNYSEKLLIPVLAALMAAPMFSSCDKEEVIQFDSINSYFLDDFTVKSDDWSVEGQALSYTVRWDVINRDVLEVGDVAVSIVTAQNEIFPLPYVYAVDYGSDVVVEQIKYSYGFGYLKILIENEQGQDLSNQVMPDFTFRVTAHLPVRNTITIDD